MSKMHLLIAIPLEDVNTILDILEEYKESIEDEGCDCDSCEYELSVITPFIANIIATAPLVKS